MPGPGGGSRGGGGGFSGGGRGGFGGGGFGGGNRGGGFGGGPRPGGFGGYHHHHGPYFGWGWGRRRYYGGGGCFGALFAPLIVAIFVLFAVVYMMIPSEDQNFGREYNEATFQAAADAKYAEYFEAGATYEDNLLLYVLVEEECDQLYFIAWVGDNVRFEINDLFGGNNSSLGYSIGRNVAQYYAYSLDSNLAAVVNDMEKEIEKLALDSSFKKATEPALPTESRLVDLTGAGVPDLTADTVNDALASFTEKTGIRTVIAVDLIDNVFPPQTMEISPTLLICVGIVAVFVVVAIYSNRKNKEKEQE